MPFPLGDLPQPGIKPLSPVSPALQVDCVPLRYQESLSGMQGVSEVRETGSGWFWGPLVGSSDRAVRTLCCGESSGAFGGEGTQGLRLSSGSGSLRAQAGLCQPQGVRVFLGGVALTGRLFCLQALSSVCRQWGDRPQSLPWARIASVGLGVLAAPPTAPQRPGCGEEAGCLRGGAGGP